MSERVAIVGSREYVGEEAVSRYVESLPIDTVVISGGARGVDTFAAVAAEARGMLVVVAKIGRPMWARLGGSAGPCRNAVIAELCTRMVAFWDGSSSGTAHAIGCAKKLGKPVDVIR